jgi:hypothetical protein
MSPRKSLLFKNAFLFFYKSHARAALLVLSSLVKRKRETATMERFPPIDPYKPMVDDSNKGKVRQNTPRFFKDFSFVSRRNAIGKKECRFSKKEEDFRARARSLALALGDAFATVNTKKRAM